MFSFESSLWSQIEEHSLGLSSEKTARSLSIERIMSVASTTEKILEITTRLQPIISWNQIPHQTRLS